MSKKYENAIFIFHRDLRLEDNTGLIKSLEESERVFPIFIFDPNQTDTQKNKYKSDNALEFLLESLKELEEKLLQKGTALSFFYGETDKVIEEILKKEKVSAVYSNFDYTPFSKNRDAKIANLCREQNVQFIQTHDALIIPPKTVLSEKGAVYTKFTPFFKKAATKNVQKPAKNKFTNYSKTYITNSTKLSAVSNIILKQKNPHLVIRGGRKNGLALLKQIKPPAEYKRTRDLPLEDGTSHLSAHNKFGTVSIREVLEYVIEKYGTEHDLVRELYWRDFFTHIANEFPSVFGNAFERKYDRIKWENNKEKFEAWKNGLCGFPIVDAGMRELNKTGFMHNRVRMIVASFLVKDLHIDWRLGERYFAQKLVDYDPAVNNGNWQWAASTGCDAQPYFRVFNPWLQQKKYDQKCQYIKKWIFELQKADAKQIHNQERNTKIGEYPTPIVDHYKESKIAKLIYRSV